MTSAFCIHWIEFMQNIDLGLLQTAFMQAWNSMVITTAEESAGYPVQIANPAFCKMTGYSLEELVGSSLKKLQGPNTDQNLINHLRTCLKEGKYFEGTTVNYKKNGESYIVRWNISPVRDSAGVITHFVSVQQDITALVKSESMRHLLASALDATDDPIILTDRDYRIIFGNKALEKITGYRIEELFGTNPEVLDASEESRNMRTDLYLRLEAGKPFRGRFVNKRRDGSSYVIEKTVSPIFDDDQKITNFVSIGKDVTDLVRKENELNKKATKDQLTGLYNRHYGKIFLDGLQKKAEAGSSAFSLILCDVDHFKNINDKFGHIVGDRVLQKIAEILAASVRSSDAVIRWGGEEFLIILDNCNKDCAHSMAERLRRKMLDIVHESVGQVTLSFGVAAYTAGESINECMSKADMALYQSKNSGRNKITLS